MRQPTIAGGEAIFSPCERYRYLLTRRLHDSAPATPERVATFIMLNPSVADATRNDPTIRKCMGFARRWQCDTLQVLNLFAVRATYPRDMKRVADPVGSDNLDWFAHALASNTPATQLVICAWGVHGTHRNQDRAILTWLNTHAITPYALGLTRHGQPRHPLYVPYATRLMAYHGP